MQRANLKIFGKRRSLKKVDTQLLFKIFQSFWDLIREVGHLVLIEHYSIASSPVVEATGVRMKSGIMSGKKPCSEEPAR